jgi:hypothetical protein
MAWKYFWHRKGFWITLPKNHFTENFWPIGHLTETPFDRTPFDQMPFDRKFIRPNRRLTERRLTDDQFFKKIIIWPNLISTKNIIWPKKNAHKVVWPLIHLTESFFWKWSFDYSLHDWNNNNDNIGTIFSFTVTGSDEEVGYMYYSNGTWTVGQMIIFRKRQFFKKKKTSGQMTFRLNDHFSKKAFDQMNFWSYVISVR